MARMLFFVNNLIAVLQAAIHESWPYLMNALRGVTTLRGIRACHDTYLTEMALRCLLPNTLGTTNTLHVMILRILRCVVHFARDYNTFLLGAGLAVHGTKGGMPCIRDVVDRMQCCIRRFHVASGILKTLARKRMQQGGLSGALRFLYMQHDVTHDTVPSSGCSHFAIS